MAIRWTKGKPGDAVTARPRRSVPHHGRTEGRRPLELEHRERGGMRTGGFGHRIVRGRGEDGGGELRESLRPPAMSARPIRIISERRTAPSASPVAARCSSRASSMQAGSRHFRVDPLFPPDAQGQRGKPLAGGPRAIDHYLEAEGAGRLIQSMKSTSCRPRFQATSIF